MTPEVIVGGAAWGDRFVARHGTPRAPGWSDAGELFGPGLPAALAAVGTVRGTGSPAVAGVLLFEQYALRLVAPVLAALLRDGEVLDARLPLVGVQALDGVVRRLAFAHLPRPATTGDAAGEVLDGLVGGNLDVVAEAVHRHTRVGTRVLRGTMANAVASTTLHLSWPCADHARYVEDAVALIARVPAWAGLVDVRAEEVDGRRWMYTDRATCCLAFRTTVNRDREQRYCLTCPVVPRATTHAAFVAATRSYAERHP